jgi:hypothetical protein
VSAVIAAAIIMTGASRRIGLTPTARMATISLSLAIRPKARRTPRRKAMGTVTARIEGSRLRKTRRIVPTSALRSTSTASSRGIWSIRRTNVKTSSPMALGAIISRTMYRSRSLGRERASRGNTDIEAS